MISVLPNSLQHISESYHGSVTPMKQYITEELQNWEVKLPEQHWFNIIYRILKYKLVFKDFTTFKLKPA